MITITITKTEMVIIMATMRFEYNWNGHESGTAPVMVIITITQLDLNLKFNCTGTCDLPESVLKLNLELYLTLSCNYTWICTFRAIETALSDQEQQL